MSLYALGGGVIFCNVLSTIFSNKMPNKDMEDISMYSRLLFIADLFLHITILVLLFL